MTMRRAAYNATVRYNTNVTQVTPASTMSLGASYTKIGNVVTVTFADLNYSSVGSNFVLFDLSLPFTSANNGRRASNGIMGYNLQGKYSGTNFTSDGQMYAAVAPNSSLIEPRFFGFNHNGAGFLYFSNSNAQLQGLTITYFAA